MMSTETDAASRLLMFPTLIPGESYYSLLARYHRLSGNRADIYTFQQLFGAKADLRAAVTLPYRIRLIDEWLPEECHMPSGLVVRECTALSYLRLSGLFTEAAYDRIQQPESLRGRNQRFDMIRALQRNTQQLRFCPDCIWEDFVEYGEPCWHLVHQIDGVKYCPIHGTRLVDSPWLNKAKLNGFYPAPDYYTAHSLALSARSCMPPDPFEKPYLELARIIDWLLKNADRFSEGKLIQLYEQELGTLNLDTLLRQLTSSGTRFLTDLYGREVLQLTVSLYEHGMKRQPPLVHALMIMSLGGIPWISRYG
jgi:hypothetical protein